MSELEEVVGRIEQSAARLTDAIKRSAPQEEKTAADEGNEEPGGAPGSVQEPAAPEPRDEDWWGRLAREDWNLVQLSWELRGVILRRGKEKESEVELRGFRHRIRVWGTLVRLLWHI